MRTKCADLGEASPLAVRVSTLCHHIGHAALMGAGWFGYLATTSPAPASFVYEGRVWHMLGVAGVCWMASYLAIGRKPWHLTLNVKR